MKEDLDHLSSRDGELLRMGCNCIVEILMGAIENQVDDRTVPGGRFLLTEDLQHHQTLGDLTVLSPFESSPSVLSTG